MAASLPVVAAAQTAQTPIPIKNLSSFAIKPADLPAGCTVMRSYDTKRDGMIPTVTCDTKEHFEAGFALPASLKAECTQEEKYVCKVTES